MQRGSSEYPSCRHVRLPHHSLQAQKAAPSTKQIKQAPQKAKKAIKRAVPSTKAPVPSRKPPGTQRKGGRGTSGKSTACFCR